jgi:hypothetical protein
MNVGDSRAIIISNNGQVLASTKDYYLFYYHVFSLTPSFRS